MRLCKTDVWPSVARGDDDLYELRLYDAAWRKRVCHERRYGVWLYPARYACFHNAGKLASPSTRAPRNSHTIAPQLPPNPQPNNHDREAIWQTKRKKRQRRSQRRRNAQLSEQTTKNNELQSQISSLESAVQKAEQEANSTKTELEELKASLDKAGDQAEKDGSDRDSAQTRIAQLEAELGTANRKASDSVSRAELLEKKIETLTQLHRDNDTRNQTRIQEHKKIEREATELRTRITGLSNENARLREAEQRRRKADLGSIEDSSVQELLDEERDRLLAKVRELEEENFELRRGVWRDRRQQMQPSIDDQADASHPYTSTNSFDDIDLSGAPSRQALPNRTHSSFQDVIQSGISAFTGQNPAHRRSDAASKPKPRQESLGSLDEFEIDEDAFRQAQEEEAKKRLERVREVKRGLVQYKGWRPDFVDVRVGMGGVFEI
ncbi:hypothetical protein IG631_18558 [Alternaria alternata]|nr:hypothetical protein IG631_18558 [Alternaria alternata]